MLQKDQKIEECCERGVKATSNILAVKMSI